MSKKILVTCALPYSNGKLHVGHIAGCYLPADIFVRYQRLNKRDVMFVSGSDDHGVPIKLTADKEGKTPKEVATYFYHQQKESFKKLGINFDVYGSTCNSNYHTKTSQDFFKTLFDKGFFEKKSSKQFFDDVANMFLPDRYVKGTCGYCGAKDQNSDQCEECGKELDVEHLKDAYSIINKSPASVKDTFHWYLDLTKFEETVSQWLNIADTREHTKKFVRGLVSQGLVKRSMTRDIDWGIPVPLDDPDAKNKVLYVWFDAPIGYISNTKEICQDKFGNFEEYSKWWKDKNTDIYHFIGEDNTVFHCVIWIAMLKAEGSFNLPKGVIVNNYLNIKFPGKEIEKISKSRGSAVWIQDYLEDGGNPDSLRYYLTTVAPEKSRSVFIVEDLIQKHNSELGNALGNFVNRVLSFYKKYYGEKIEYTTKELNSIDKDFENSRLEIINKVGKLIEEYSFKQAQDSLFDFIRSCNKYIDEKQPWTSRKTDEAETKNTLIQCFNAMFTIGILLNPFLPFSAKKILSQLGISEQIQNSLTWQCAKEKLENGHNLGNPEILFAKIEDK